MLVLGVHDSWLCVMRWGSAGAASLLGGSLAWGWARYGVWAVVEGHHQPRVCYVEQEGDGLVVRGGQVQHRLWVLASQNQCWPAGHCAILSPLRENIHPKN